jgi:hypothetical protein
MRGQILARRAANLTEVFRGFSVPVGEFVPVLCRRHFAQNLDAHMCLNLRDVQVRAG